MKCCEYTVYWSKSLLGSVITATLATQAVAFIFSQGMLPVDNAYPITYNIAGVISFEKINERWVSIIGEYS